MAKQPPIPQNEIFFLDSFRVGEVRVYGGLNKQKLRDLKSSIAFYAPFFVFKSYPLTSGCVAVERIWDTNLRVYKEANRKLDINEETLYNYWGRVHKGACKKQRMTKEGMIHPRSRRYTQHFIFPGIRISPHFWRYSVGLVGKPDSSYLYWFYPLWTNKKEYFESSPYLWLYIHEVCLWLLSRKGSPIYLGNYEKTLITLLDILLGADVRKYSKEYFKNWDSWKHQLPVWSPYWLPEVCYPPTEFR